MFLDQRPRKSIDMAQRRTEVMRNRIGEGFQFVVGSCKLCGTLSHATLQVFIQFLNLFLSPFALDQLQVELAERKRAEEQIEKLNEDLERRVADGTAQLAATNDELEAFSYSVSHDLRAPLRHINGFSGTLIEEHSSQLVPEAQQLLKRIKEGTQKMARMIDDLLNLARLDRRSMTLQMTSLNSLVENALHDLESETTDRKIDWRVGSLPPVNCDPGLIRQVFANLLSKAAKYTRRRERAVIEIDQSTVEGQLVLFVRDNGAGFNSKYSDKLFGTFQRLHSDQEFEGTGL